MKLLPSSCLGLPGRTSQAVAVGVFALAMFTMTLPTTALAQNRGPEMGRGGPPMGRPDVRVSIEDPHAGPRFLVGPNREEFRFVRPAPGPRFIDSRDTLRDLLLRPLAASLVWGIGDIATVELANMLGLPVNTPVYAVQAGVPIYSTLPPGYFVAESLPQNVALVTYGPAGEVVLSRRVPPGAFIAYQTSPQGVVLGECVVVPPQQQIIMPTLISPPPTIVVTSPAPAPTPAAPTAPTPAQPSTSSVPMSSTKSGKIVYDSNGKPIGVIVTEGNGQQEFVPLQ